MSRKFVKRGFDGVPRGDGRFMGGLLMTHNSRTFHRKLIAKKRALQLVTK